MATGRKTVAPGQTIASQWGNWVWDQSIQTFATLADLQTQFPNPPRGATVKIDQYPNATLWWDGAHWVAEQWNRANPTTNGAGTAVIGMPLAYGPAVVPSFLVQVVASAPPYDYICLLDYNNSTNTQVAFAVFSWANRTPAGNLTVPTNWVARGWVTV